MQKTYHIKGMHCKSCEALIERKLKRIEGVTRAHVNYAQGTADVHFESEPTLEQLQGVIQQHGYTISEGASEENGVSLGDNSNLLDTLVVAITLAILYFFATQFNLLPDVGVTESMTYGFILVLGIVASLSTCLALTGGLLLSISARHAEFHPNATGYTKFKPHIYFNAGRILSYTLLGGLVGVFGSLITLSPFMNGLLTFLVSFVMIALGLQLLHIPYLSRYIPTAPKKYSHLIHNWSDKHPTTAPFTAGALTFFLPCGFTQALQLYVLSQGSFVLGATTMFFFSLGTLPGLLSIGLVSSYSSGDFKRYFMKAAGLLVLVFAVYSMTSGWTLLTSATSFGQAGGIPTAYDDPNVKLVDGIQVVNMAVRGLDYYPDSFTLKAGIPVEWRIDGSKAQGCAQILVLPQMRINQQLMRSGTTVIRFTPPQKGRLTFTCGMGMAGPGTFNVI